MGGTVLACRSTLKLEDVLQEAQDEIKKAREQDIPETESNEPKDVDQDEKSEKRNYKRERDVAFAYVSAAADVVKLYAPAIIISGAGIACLTKSHSILTSRNAAITAAYAALDRGFREYRARVVDKYGPDQDREFRYGSEKVEVADPDDGRKKKTVTRVGPEGASVYAKFFDPLSPSWSKDPEDNMYFLKAQQNYANNVLISRGHLFLNEVYDMLGIPHTKAGSVVGWLRSDDGSSDNHVDFGIFDENEKVIDFVNGREAAILLDFNVDGLIYDRIEKPDRGLSWQRGS
jgi:hypothetical protein